MAIQTPTPTHQAVQEYYGKAVREATSCCASSPASEASSCCGAPAAPQEIQNNLYPRELLAGIPSDIVQSSAGSGDPISLAQLNPGETVLDLGSGGGLDCILAARQVGASGHVIGVEMTPEMLALAHSNVARMGLQNIEFREGYLEALPVADATIDVVISNCVINLSSDKPQVFCEIYRALKPGGRFALSDMVTNHPLPEEARANEGWCGCINGALQLSEYKAELGRAGFVDIRIEPNLEVVIKAFESGHVKSQRGLTKEQLLEDLRSWDKIESRMVVPHKISARKPA